MHDVFTKHAEEVAEEDHRAYHRWWRLALVRGREIERQRREIEELKRRLEALEAERCVGG